MPADRPGPSPEVYAAAGIYVFGDSMSDDKNKTGAQDRARISLSDDYEVRDWAEKFGVSRQALRDAVARVGNLAEDVQRELGGRR